MLVWCFIGIGVCILVLCSSDGNKAADEGDTMSTTSAQLADMLRENEKDRRRERFETGISSAQHGTRIPSKRRGAVKGNKGNSRSRGWENF